MTLSSTSFNMTKPGSKADNPNYKCIITQYGDSNQKKLVITAHLPEEYEFNLGAVYETPFSQSIADNVGSTGKNIAGAMGFQFVNKALTTKVWQGSNDFSFVLRLVLQAETDVYLDVIKPLESLYRLVVPREPVQGGLLRSPGPHLDYEKLKELLSGAAQAAVDVAVDFASNTVDGLVSSGKEVFKDPLGSAANGLSGAWEGVKSTYSGMVDAANYVGADNLTSRAINDTAGAVEGAAAIAEKKLANLSNALISATKNRISVQIGTFQTMESVVVTNVSQVTKVRPIENSQGMSRIEVDVSFSTFTALTDSDIQYLLPGSSVLSGQDVSSPLGSSSSPSVDYAPASILDSNPSVGLRGPESLAPLLGDMTPSQVLSVLDKQTLYKLF